MKRSCGNVYSTSERNYQMLTRYKQRVVLTAVLEGKSMPFNMVDNTIINHTTLLKNTSLKCVSSQISGVRWLLCALSIFGISTIPTHSLKEVLVMWPLSASGLLLHHTQPHWVVLSLLWTLSGQQFCSHSCVFISKLAPHLPLFVFLGTFLLILAKRPN